MSRFCTILRGGATAYIRGTTLALRALLASTLLLALAAGADVYLYRRPHQWAGAPTQHQYQQGVWSRLCDLQHRLGRALLQYQL